MRHISVLLDEAISNLNLKKGYRAIDCTLGDGGHSEKILENVGADGRVLGIDADTEAILSAKRILYRFGEQMVFVRDNFKNLKKIAEENNFYPVEAILLDLGWSTPQFSERGRGFSFEGDEPLDMRYYKDPNDENPFNAAFIVNEYDKKELEKIFKNFGEEKFYKEITEEILSQRKEARIASTKQLVETILKVYREKLKSDKEIPWVGGIHPATKVFQALRMAVNDELNVLKEVLPQATELLSNGGRLAVISFHSGEDRIVKRFFQSLSSKDFQIITKKPIVASENELKNNLRARSAKLRVVQKI